MRTPIRKATLAIGFLLLGCAVIVLIRSTHSSPDGNEWLCQESTSIPEPGQPGGEATTLDGEPIGRTKVKERPIETDLDKMRKERHRLVEKMKTYQGNGLGERHPSMVTLMRDLKKVEAEIAATGEGTKVKERPIETDLDKKRKKRRQLVEKMKTFQDDGLGERHPSMLTLMDDLKKMDDEIAAAGEGTNP